MPDRIVASRTYVLVCVALLSLTVATIGLAQLDLRGWNSALALVIAAVKAVLIGLFFMHLRWSSGMSGLVGVAALLWLAILIVGTLDDLLTRGWLPIPGK
jgi:cytochrome c oxidase subunit IV